MLWRLLCVALVSLLLTPHAEAVKTRRTQVYAASHYVTQGNGGPFTFVASASGGADASGSSVATSSTLDIQTGDLLITLVSFEDGNGSETVSVTDQGDLNPHTITAGDAAYETSNLTSVYPLYRLSGVAHTGATFTATLSTARSFKRIIVMQYRPPTGAVVTKDITGTRKATGNGPAISTGLFSTQGVHGVVCGMEAIYTGGSHSNSEINGVAAENTKQQNGAYQWCLRTTAGLANVVATTDYSASRQWAATALAFHAEGGTFVDTDPPLAPTSLAGTIGDAQVALTWSHANVPDVHHYSLQYDCGGGYLTWSPAPTSASATITGLANETACNIRVAAVDDSGNVSSYTSPIAKTPTATPIRSAGAPSGSLASGTTSTTLSLTTSKNATCKYSTTAGTAYGSMSNTFTGAGTKSHTATASGLSDGTTFHYYVRCDDGSSHTNLDDYEITFSVISGGPWASTFGPCTSGVDCMCDRMQGNGPLGTSDPIYNTGVVYCEDFDNDNYTALSPTDSTGSFGGHNIVATSAGCSFGSNDRGCDSYLSRRYLPADGGVLWSNGTPTSPTYGPTCAIGGICSGFKVWTADDRWNANSYSPRWKFVQPGQFDDETPGSSEPTIPDSGGSSVFGDAAMGSRVGPGNYGGTHGTVRFSTINQVGLIQAMAFNSNLIASDVIGDAWKFDETFSAGWDNLGGSLLGFRQTNSSQLTFPLQFPISSAGTGGISNCTARADAAIETVGEVASSACSGGGLVVRAKNDGSEWNFTQDWDIHQWHCLQTYVDFRTITAVHWKTAVDGVVYIDVVFDLSGTDNDVAGTDGIRGFEFNNYSNQESAGTGVLVNTNRYADNYAIRNGTPPDCSDIGFPLQYNATF